MAYLQTSSPPGVSQMYTW